MDLAGRRALVVGTGRSGVAACRLLLRRGALVRAVDSDPRAAERPEVVELAGLGVPTTAGPHDAAQLGHADLVVLSPGVPPDVAPVAEARRHGVDVVGELELGARLTRAKLLGITGTVGKSTTTTLAARMLASSGVSVTAGGNLGRPLCDMVLAEGEAPGTYCLELSSFQCETLERARFAVVALLNAFTNHADRYVSFEDYRGAKLHLLDQQDGAGWAVLPADAGRVDAASGVGDAAARARGHVARFGSAAARPGVHREGGAVVSTLPGAEGQLFDVAELWTSAPHHVGNAMAAAAVALCAGATKAGVRRALSGFFGLPHRTELVATGRGPRFVNDSKATSVIAAVAAIRGSAPGTVVILGGRHAGGDLSPLREALVAVAGRAVLLGEAADEIAGVLGAAVPTARAASLGEAVEIAASQAGPGGTVLLAPACPSFDMFRNYEERGERFRQEAVARFGSSGDARDAGGHASRPSGGFAA